MIISYKRLPGIASWDPLWRYLMKPADNPRVVSGSTELLDLAYQRAAPLGHPVQIRHFIASPGLSVTDAEVSLTVQEIAAEWQMDPDEALVVEHNRPRNGRDIHPFHYHVCFPEVRADGSIIDDCDGFYRMQKVGRLIELKLGHPLTKCPDLYLIFEELLRSGLRKEAAAVLRELRGQKAAA